MTDEIMILHTLLEKGSDADCLRKVTGFTARRLMELEVEGKRRRPWGKERKLLVSSPLLKRAVLLRILRNKVIDSFDVLVSQGVRYALCR
jgi:hypothetical protein